MDFRILSQDRYAVKAIMYFDQNENIPTWSYLNLPVIGEDGMPIGIITGAKEEDDKIEVTAYLWTRNLDFRMSHTDSGMPEALHWKERRRDSFETTPDF